MTKMILVFMFLVSHAMAQDLTIFDVRKNLPMSDADKIYRDFYINGGSEAGLSAGMVITVERRLPLYDNYQNRSAGDLQLKVAKIKIIHVQKGLSVARLFSEFTRENAPLLEDNFIMIGDRLDLASASSEGKKAESEHSPEPIAASPKESASAPQIVVNSVQITTEAPKLPSPAPVDTATLQ